MNKEYLWIYDVGLWRLIQKDKILWNFYKKQTIRLRPAAMARRIICSNVQTGGF